VKKDFDDEDKFNVMPAQEELSLDEMLAGSDGGNSEEKFFSGMGFIDSENMIEHECSDIVID
jgi:hypothetical protein